MKKQKLEQAMWHCYRQLFAHSTPPANFDDLVENATLNDRGQKEIPFNDYELDYNKFNEILEQTIKDFKITNLYKQPFRNSIYLGCSPKFKKNENSREEERAS
jgi:hypothetical protein